MDGGAVMKKNWTGLRTLLMGTAAAIVLIAATACTNPVSDVLGSKSWGLLGTWVNQSYGPYYPTVTQASSIYLGGDGTFKSTSTMGILVGTYSIDSVSISGTVRTYQITVVTGSPAPTTTWVLARVTNGTTYESVSSIYAKPISISQADMTYGQLTLQ
jgi:hypothetical protein